MKTRFAVMYILVFALLIGLILGCGGSKEKVTFEPDPFPEPPPQPKKEPERTVEPPAPAEDELRKDEVLVLETVHFEFDKSELTPEAKAILAENARKLLENPGINIRIEGHCDERGTVEYNLALGERRANSARNYLINFGVASDRMSIISYGEERPVDPASNSVAWAKNRRAEFVILNR